MNIKEIIEANSFAVIGASKDETKVGHVIFKNLISNGIKTYPININAESILGYKSYKSVLELKEDIDCVIISIPAKGIKKVLNDIIKKKIKNIIIISSGFSENGNEKLSDEVKEICLKNKINLLGPNTLGYINPYKNTNASFSDIMPEKGHIAFLSQSGAIGAAILDKKVFLSGFVSLGNSLLSDFSDFINYYSSDKNTEVIVLYIESLKTGEGKSFIDACRNCKKPIIALKSGKTEKGAIAASSHTAALASPEGVYEGIFKQCGIIETSSIRELFNVAETLVKIKKPGKKALIVTNAGGPGVLVTDSLLKNNIEIAEIPENIKKRLNNVLPLGWSKNNPIDILGDAKADRYEKTIQILNEEKFYDFIIVLMTPQQMTEPEKTTDSILSIKLNKPIIFCMIGGIKVYWAIEKIKNKVPVFNEIEDMAKTLGKIINQ